MQESKEYKSLFSKVKAAIQKSLDKIQELPLDEVEKLRRETNLLFENFNEKSEKILFERSKKRKKDLTQFSDLLPGDVWATVFSYSEIRDLLNTLRVSRYFNSIIEDHPIAISSIPFESFEKKVRFFDRFVKKRYNNIKMVTVCPSFYSHCLKNNIIFKGCKEIETSKLSVPEEVPLIGEKLFSIFPKINRITYKWSQGLGNELFKEKGSQIQTLDTSKMVWMLTDFSKLFPLFVNLKKIRLRSENAKVLASLLTNCLKLEEVNINAVDISSISGLEGRSILESLKVLKLHFRRVHCTGGNVSDVVPNFVKYFSNITTLRVFWFSFGGGSGQGIKEFVEKKLRGSKLVEGMGKILKHNKKNLISLKLFYSFKKIDTKKLRLKSLEYLSAVGYKSSYLLRKIIDKKWFDNLKTLKITFACGDSFKNDSIYQMNITKLIIATYLFPANIFYQKFQSLKVLHINSNQNSKAKLRITSSTLKKLYTVDEDGEWSNCVFSFVEIDCPRLKYLKMRLNGELIIRRNNLREVDFSRYYFPRNVIINTPCNIKSFQIPLKDPSKLVMSELAVFENLTKLEVFVHLFLVLKISSVKRLKILKLIGTSRKKVEYHYSYLLFLIGEFENLLELTLEDFSFVIFNKKGKKMKKNLIKKNENLKKLKIVDMPDIPILEVFFQKFENMEYFGLVQHCRWKNASKMQKVGKEILGCLPKQNNLKNLFLSIRGINTQFLIDGVKECKNLQFLKIDTEWIVENELILENRSVNSLILYNFKEISLEKISFPNLKNFIIHGVRGEVSLITQNILGKFSNLEKLHIFSDSSGLKKNSKRMDGIFNYIKLFEKRKLRVLSLPSHCEYFDISFQDSFEYEKKFLDDLRINLYFKIKPTLRWGRGSTGKYFPFTDIDFDLEM